MRCFIVPRGVVVNAGGKADPQGKKFELAAEVGSETFGIMSSPFLDQAFKTIRYTLKVMFQNDGQFSYIQDTQLQIQGRQGVFHHTDQNALTRQSLAGLFFPRHWLTHERCSLGRRPFQTKITPPSRFIDASRTVGK